MIPFTRMLKYGYVIPISTDILDWDFSSMPLGATALPDGSGGFFEKHGTFSGRVIYDEDLGANVYDLSGNSGYARTKYLVQGTKFDFSQYDAFEITYSLKFSATGTISFFETGGFDSRRISGFSNTFNQYPSTYNQLFFDTGTGGNYYRALMSGANPNAWDEITLTFRKGISITMHSKLRNTTDEFQWYPVLSNASQYFSFFGSYVNGDVGGLIYPYTGRVGYVRIKEL